MIQEKKQKEALTRKQEKNRTKVQKQEEDSGPTELLQKPREYIVKFAFPDPPPLQPPILGLHSKLFFLNLVDSNKISNYPVANSDLLQT